MTHFSCANIKVELPEEANVYHLSNGSNFEPCDKNTSLCGECVLSPKWEQRVEIIERSASTDVRKFQ